MRHILVGLDGSLESEQILGEVCRVASADTTIDLLHVIPGVDQEVPGLGLNLEDVAESILDRAAARLPGRQVRTFIWRGEPEEEIPKAALSLEADLLALTTQSHRGVSRVLMGSVAETVVRNISIPVLLTHPGLPPRQKTLRRILVALDGSEGCLRVMDVVKDLAVHGDAEVILLQVVVPLLVTDPVTGFSPVGVPSPLPDPTASLERLVHQLALEGIPARKQVAYGDVTDMILDHARALDVDLIAMATSGRKGFSRLVRGSVAEEVLRHADRAVLLHRVASPLEVSTQNQGEAASGAD